MLLPALLFLTSMVPISYGPGERIHGSGVLINPSLVLTAQHVVDAIDRGTVRCGSEDIPAALVASDPTEDLALLELATPCNLAPSKLSTQNPPAGEEIHAVGCPASKCGWQVYGHVVGYDVRPGPNGKPRTVLIGDNAIWFGHSGGPLYNSKGVVVGITTQLFTMEGPDDLQRIYSAFVPAETIIRFLKEAGL